MAEFFLVINAVAILVSTLLAIFQYRVIKQQNQNAQKAKEELMLKLEYRAALSKARRELIKASEQLDALYELQEEMEEAEERRSQIKKMRNGATHPRCSICGSRHCDWDHARNNSWGHPAKPTKVRK